MRNHDLRAWMWLAVAALLLPFSNGADSAPLAAWIAPIFLLRFVRRQPGLIGLPIAYLVLVVAMAFQFRGMVPIPGIGYYIFLVSFGLTLVFPYALDRLLVPRLTGLAATLVFPAAWAVIEYLVSFGPYGTWGSAAYSQYGGLALLQLLSITGLWGITFLIGWAAAVVNQLWEEGLESRPARVMVLACAAMIAGVVMLGGIRLAEFRPVSQVVRVASLSKQVVRPALDQHMFYRMFTGQATDADLPIIRNWASTLDDDLMKRSEREMQAGASIVFWGESNALVLKEDEAAFIARGSALAARYHAYLGMGLGVSNRDHMPPNENLMVLIAPDGSVAWEYSKSHPVPGGEAAMQIPGDGKLKFSDTAYGRLSSVICFDADFPQLLAQAGAAHTDLLLDPSSDWRAIDPWHTQMASFRAIEQGFNLVRQTDAGLSAAYDYQGRLLSEMDHFMSTDHSMVAAVPTRGAVTLYSRLGDWFAWFCAALLLAVGAKATTARRR